MSILKTNSKPEIQADVSYKLCTDCFCKLAPGIAHDCCKSSAVSNLILLAFTIGSLQAEQTAAGIIKTKMDHENISDGAEFYLSTGGNPLKIKVGTPDKKTDRKTAQQISVGLIKELQVVLELSARKTEKLISSLRRGLDSRLCVESNIFGKLQQLEESVSHFYHVDQVCIICMYVCMYACML